MRKANKDRDILKNKKGYEIFPENSFLIGIAVFGLALFINFLLELDFTKNIFNWTGYYFESFLYWLNTTLQATFKDHPYINIPLFVNPLTPAIMAIISPWMWIRGFLIASFVMGKEITIWNVKIMKPQAVIFTALLAGLFQLCVYAVPYSAQFSGPVFMLLLQKFYINILVLIFICIAGILSGVEYGVYLFRNKKIEVNSKKDGPRVDVQYTDKFDW